MLAEVELKRTPTSGFAPLTAGTDPTSAITPYEIELKELFQQNKQVNGGEDNDYNVVISSLFDTAVGGGDFKQSMGYHLRFHDQGAWRDLLDDTFASPASYVNKAADYASPCPSDCVSYRVR